jgi:diamine N-acetyltransferase
MQLDSSLRLARASDAECLAALSVHVWLNTYADAGVSDHMARYVLSEFAPVGFRRLLADANVAVVVAEAAEGLAGYALLRFGVECPGRVEPTCELEKLYVLPRFTRSGIGSRLLAASQNLVQDRTKTRGLWLSVYAHNEAALAFYRKHGCERMGSIDFELGGERHENYVFVAGHA